MRFTNAAKGNEKGHVEKSVEYIRKKCFAQQIEFEDIQAANKHLLKKLKTLNQKPVAEQQRVLQLCLPKNKNTLKPCPSAATKRPLPKPVRLTQLGKK